jgi:hypothetical protein
MDSYSLLRCFPISVSGARERCQDTVPTVERRQSLSLRVELQEPLDVMVLKHLKQRADTAFSFVAKASLVVTTTSTTS